MEISFPLVDMERLHRAQCRETEPNWSCRSYCFVRKPAFTIPHAFNWVHQQPKQTLEQWQSFPLPLQLPGRHYPMVLPPLAFGSLQKNLKKSEETWPSVRNSDLKRSLSLCASLSRCIFLETISGSILRPVSCPMLNLETKKYFCFSLEPHGFFLLALTPSLLSILLFS